MASEATAKTAIGRMQQQLHRHELKLARLKNSLNKERQSDSRLKLRLGGLLYLVGWENLPEYDLEIAVKSVLKEIRLSEDTDALKIAGANFLRKLESDKPVDADPAALGNDERRKLVHQKITKGGVMVKHQLQTFDRATILGALLNLTGDSKGPERSSMLSEFNNYNHTD